LSKNGFTNIISLCLNLILLRTYSLFNEFIAYFSVIYQQQIYLTSL